ncbi:MAG: hypothetical protein ACI4GD_09010 [Lachnospiraceae bacterium]
MKTCEKELFLAYLEFKKNKGHRISPMNTEPCRKYLQEKLGRTVQSEDILFLFYHEKELREKYAVTLK